MKVELTLTKGGGRRSHVDFHITLNIHCFYVTLFIFNQFSISILCGVMFIIMVFNTQILVHGYLWMYILEKSVIVLYFVSISYIHIHIYYKLKATQILKIIYIYTHTHIYIHTYFLKKLKEKFTTTHK